MKMIISDVDMGQAEVFMVSREYMLRLSEYIKKSIPLPEIVQPAQQPPAACTCPRFESGTKVFPMRECDGCKPAADTGAGEALTVSLDKDTVRFYLYFEREIHPDASLSDAINNAYWRRWASTTQVGKALQEPRLVGVTNDYICELCLKEAIEHDYPDFPCKRTEADVLRAHLFKQEPRP